jgi:hypothetical protein
LILTGEVRYYGLRAGWVGDMHLKYIRNGDMYLRCVSPLFFAGKKICGDENQESRHDER